MTNAHCRLSKNKSKCVMQELLDADIHTFDDKLKISLFNKISYLCEHLNFQFFIYQGINYLVKAIQVLLQT